MASILLDDWRKAGVFQCMSPEYQPPKEGNMAGKGQNWVGRGRNKGKLREGVDPLPSNSSSPTLSLPGPALVTLLVQVQGDPEQSRRLMQG